MDALAASLRELTETVRALPRELAPAHNSIMLNHIRGRSSDADVSLARSQTHPHDYFSMWTVCVVL